MLSVVKPHYPASFHILHFNVVNPIIASEKERILEPKHSECIKNSTELNRIELNLTWEHSLNSQDIHQITTRVAWLRNINVY